MSDFDPGEGWREVEDNPPGETERVMYASGDGEYRYWVRDVPVLPLPTEPYTVIRATLEGEAVPRYLVSWSYSWCEVGKGFLVIADLERITGFEVLAEPIKPQPLSDQDFADKVRRETAKAVHDYLLQLPDYYGAQRIASKFGVES